MQTVHAEQYCKRFTPPTALEGRNEAEGSRTGMATSHKVAEAPEPAPPSSLASLSELDVAAPFGWVRAEGAASTSTCSFACVLVLTSSSRRFCIVHGSLSDGGSYRAPAPLRGVSLPSPRAVFCASACSATPSAGWESGFREFLGSLVQDRSYCSIDEASSVSGLTFGNQNRPRVPSAQRRAAACRRSS